MYTIVCEIWTHGIEMESKKWISERTKTSAHKEARAWFKDAFIDDNDINLEKVIVSDDMEQWVYDN